METVSGEDDVVEVSLDENSDDKQEEMQKEHNIESSEKYNYLNCLGLITKSKCMELQNRRVERKRRSTANPQFVYSMFEQPSVSISMFLFVYVFTCKIFSKWESFARLAWPLRKYNTQR